MPGSKPVASPAPSGALFGPTLVPRILVGALTALVVARPLVAGDDPGRLSLTAGGGALTLNLFVLIVLLCWCVWNGVTRCGTALGGAVTVTLACIAGLAFVANATTTFPSYARAGWFVCWEWVVLAVLFCLTRQLANLPGSSTGMLSAIVASAVSLSAFSVYEHWSGPLGLPSSALPKPGIMPPLVGDQEFPQGNLHFPGAVGKSSRESGVMADAADTFACFLLLVVPVLAWSAWSGMRARDKRGWLLCGCALLVTIALALSLASGWIGGWRKPMDFESIALHLWGTFQGFMRDIVKSPWLGYGPDRLAQHGTPEVGWAAIGWAIGLAALTLLFASIGLVGWRLVRATTEGSRNAETIPPAVRSVQANTVPMGPRWEFYLGGVAGLLLGFVLSTGDIPAELPPRVMLQAGVVAAFRSILWFAIFALFENIVWPPNQLVRCLSLGLGLSTLYGCFSKTVSLPPVSWTFWVIAGIALNVASESPLPSGRRSRSALWVWAPIPLALALVVANLIQAAYPGLSTTHEVRQARDASRHISEQERPIASLTGLRRLAAIHMSDRYLNRNILDPLRRALRNDPDNAELLVELARWSRMHWQHLLGLREEKAAADLARQILGWTNRAKKLNPWSAAGLAGTIEALLLFVDESKTLRKERLEALENSLAELSQRVPTVDIILRRRVVEALLDLVERPAKERGDMDQETLRHALQMQAADYLDAELTLERQRRDRGTSKLSDLTRLAIRLRLMFPDPSPALREALAHLDAMHTEKPAE